MNNILDLSEHNGNIDFAKVRKAGYSKVILRLGWIGNKENHTLDQKFNTYYSKAKYYGFKIGIYVYSYCKTLEALKSACLWCEKNLKELEIDLPIFLDLEDNSISSLTKQMLTNQALYFCNYFEKKGYKTGIYASKYWFLNKLNINKLVDYKIWLAEWTSKQNHSLGYKVDLWQFTDKGKVTGINGNVDISKCLCKCEEKEESKKEVFNMAKTYKNGSTKEPVFSDSNLSNQIGSLNPKETCECLGIVNSRYIVKYKIDGTKNYKVGFVKYSGGVK